MTRREMRIGDVWRSRSARVWLVIRFGGTFDHDTYGLCLDYGNATSPSWPDLPGEEVCLSSDRIAANDWELVSELTT